MSVTDPAEPVQPEEGQGEPGQADAPYAEYLNRLPEEVRGDVEPIFREWDSNVTKRFQEHSEQAKAWQPYEQLGVNQLSPEDVQEALQFRQAVYENPQGIWDWAQQYAQQHGLTQQQAAELAQQQGGLDEFGLQDPNQQFEQLLSQRLSPFEQQLEQLTSVLTDQQQQAAQQQAQQFIEGQLAELEKTHGEEFSREAVELFVPNFIESDPQHAVPRAFEAYQQMRNQIEKSALQGKVDAPGPAEGGGVADVTPPQYTSISDPEMKQAAIDFMRNSNRA